jgi:hypothetical protein
MKTNPTQRVENDPKVNCLTIFCIQHTAGTDSKEVRPAFGGRNNNKKINYEIKQ